MIQNLQKHPRFRGDPGLLTDANAGNPDDRAVPSLHHAQARPLLFRKLLLCQKRPYAGLPIAAERSKTIMGPPAAEDKVWAAGFAVKNDRSVVLRDFFRAHLLVRFTLGDDETSAGFGTFGNARHCQDVPELPAPGRTFLRNTIVARPG